eukprot:scaffold20310_cov125-Isochrysis_galbana.AAC.20
MRGTATAFACSCGKLDTIVAANEVLAKVKPGRPTRGVTRGVTRIDNIIDGPVARPRPAHSSSLKEEDGRPCATTRLPAGRMRAALESMREFSRHMTAATWRTKRLLRLRKCLVVGGVVVVVGNHLLHVRAYFPASTIMLFSWNSFLGANFGDTRHQDKYTLIHFIMCLVLPLRLPYLSTLLP